MPFPEVLSKDLLCFKQTSEVTLPFLLKTNSLSSEKLVCTNVLRLLSGKRLVCKASYKETNALVKLFFGSGFKKRWQRELDGLLLIQKAGINTPNLIEASCDIEQSFAVIVFEFIENAQTLGQILKEKEQSDGRLEIFQKALSLIAAMHQACIYQRDVHLDNFLYDQKTVYLIDGDQVELKDSSVGLDETFIINNLAMFFTQLHQWEGAYIKSLFEKYITLNNRVFSRDFFSLIIKRLGEYRNWRENKYINKKVFRQCSAFDVIKTWQTFCVFSRNFDKKNASRFIENPDTLISDGIILKSGRTATVAKIQLDGKAYIVKRYNRKGRFHQVARCLMESRAAVSWKNAHLLEFNDIPTAKPLLILENRWGPLRGRSYVVTDYLEGMHVFDYFNSDIASSSQKSMAININKLIQHLHQCNYAHGDLKAHNIWITGGQPILIDLDGMKKVKNNTVKDCQNDWLRLYRDLNANELALQLFEGFNNHCL